MAWFRKIRERRETRQILEKIKSLEEEQKSIKTMVAVLLAEYTARRPVVRPAETRQPRRFDLAERQ